MALTASSLRQDIYRLLDEVLATGDPLVVERKGQKLVITRAEEDPPPPPPGSRLARLRPHPDAITGDPDDLDGVTWADAWRP